MTRPCFYDIFMLPLEYFGLRRLRRRVLRNVSGRILELGAGTAANASFYPPFPDLEIIAVEPSREKVLCAEPRRKNYPHIVWIQGLGENLPFAEATFDRIVATLVLCSVHSLENTLAEFRRVLQPDGTLHILEHVRPPQPWLGRIFDWLTPPWKLMSEGCHLNRESGAAIEEAGFTITQRRFYLGGVVQSFEACLSQPSRR
ncbi:MAG: class I SAM-dependent methyltransferase [Candidatus Marinimicrobia bacterium]|nr:class I SAM-dependent methyltransferase [Candidatus Neomarinimicrobiota bacterium]MCF7840579.1 class I SAM-dependent methyltransferase [Candidatus Neomarinimicrobiota bacterium]